MRTLPVTPAARGLRTGLAVFVAVLTVAGCSRSGLSADAWVVSVCRALAPWRTEITEINQRAAIQMAQTSTAEQARSNLVDLVSDARDATEIARGAVAAAGVPDVSGGESVARGFERSLTTMRDAYAEAADDLLALPDNDEAAFYDGVVDVMNRLTRQYDQAGAELAELDSPELREAFDRAPECQ